MYILLALLAVMVLLPFVNYLIFATDPQPGSKMLVVAHRGAPKLAPENTLAALDSALAYQPDYTEIDVHLSKDGQLVVVHDRTLDRTTNGKGKITDLTYDEIASYNASKSLPGYPHATRVPLLKEILLKIKPTNTKLIIEVKNPGAYPGIASKIAETIRETATTHRVAVFSFDAKVVAELKSSLPGIETGLFVLGPGFTSARTDYASPHWLTALYLPFQISRMHAQGCRVLVWTPDSPFVVRCLRKMKVDGIITDNPDLLRHFQTKNHP